MKKLIVPLLFSVAALASGCISHNANTASAPLQVRLVANELKADVVVGEKISGQAKVTYFFGIPFGGTNKYADGVLYDGTIITDAAVYGATPKDDSFFGSFFSLLTFSGLHDEVRASAAYDAITKSSADIIISPRYVLDVQNFWIFKNVEAQVTGYKGTIKSIH